MAASTKGTIIVTGANGSLGSTIVELIASKPELSAHYFGLYTVREASAAPALAAALSRGSSAHQHDVVSLELTDLDNVRQVARDINSRVSSGKIPPIRALILNAGYLSFGIQAWTSDGYDITFMANYLGHWLLTLLLLQSMDKESGRILIMGSQGSDPADPRNALGGTFADARYKQLMGDDEAAFEALAKGTWSPAKEDPSWRSGYRRYCVAKLCLLLMMYELQHRMDQDGALSKVCILGVDPGTMATGLQRHGSWFIRLIVFGIGYRLIGYLFPNRLVRTLKYSAADVLEGAFGAGLGGQEGPPKALYLDKWGGGGLGKTRVEAQDARKRKLVWTESVKHTQLREGETVLGNWR